MKAYDVSGSEVSAGIEVSTERYSKLVLGDGGNKRATWIPLGSRDAKRITEDDGKVREVGVIALCDKETNEPNGKHLIVAPRNGKDNRILVLWRVSSGYRGSAHIEAGEGVHVVGYDSAWHSGRGNLGETAEMLAILKPGQELNADISGRRVQENRARLTWDGETIEVIYGDDSIDVIEDEEPEGDYI